MASLSDHLTETTSTGAVYSSNTKPKPSKRPSKDKPGHGIAKKPAASKASLYAGNSLAAGEMAGGDRSVAEVSHGVNSWRDELGDISLSGMSDIARSPSYGEVMKFVERHDSTPTVAGGAATDHFQIILMAPTSAAVPISQESLTYLNQGQSYEVLCKKLGPDNQPLANGKYQTVVSLCFHERRHKFEEKRLIEEWRKCHPNELPLAADTPVSVNVSKVHSGGTNVEFVWDSAHTTSMYIKVNMISTEFSARKRGGEKGVPFRLTISSFRFDADSPAGGQLLHSCYAQIRVFRLKGADRRNRLDRERAEKRLDSERFQPAYDYTIMTETFPNDLSNCETEQVSDCSCPNSTRPNCGLEMIAPGEKEIVFDGASTDKASGETTPVGSDDTSVTVVGSELISPLATVSETISWLKANRFGLYLDAFSDYNAADLLRLNVDSIQQIIANLADAYRLYNLLRAKNAQPRTKIFLRLRQPSVFTAIFLHEMTASELVRSVLATLADGGFTGSGQPITVSEIVWRCPAYDILVKVTDELVANWADEQAFTAQLVDDNCDASIIGGNVAEVATTKKLILSSVEKQSIN